MTACNNVQDANLGKKAVSAALAGTLAVGMVPAAALAAEAPEAGDGITALTADEVAQFQNAKISQIKLNGGAAQATPTGAIEIVSGTANAGVVPTQLTSVITGNTLSVFDDEGEVAEGLEIVYTNADGSAIASGDANSDGSPKGVGSYTVQVKGLATIPAPTEGDPDATVAGPYAGLASAKVNFNIVGKSLSGATLYEVQENAPKNISDTTFTYTGVAQQIGVALNGAALDSDNWTVKYYNAAGNTLVANGDATAGANTNLPINAGDYIAVVSGAEDSDYEGSEAQIKFSVGKLDLSSSDVVVSDVQFAADAAAETDIVTINGKEPSDALAGELEISYPVVPTKIGSYQAVVAPEAGNAQAAANIAGSKTVSYSVVTNDQIVVQYNNAAWEKTYDVDLSKGGSFSTSAIKVYAGKTQDGNVVADGAALTAGQYTVTVTDKDGKAVPASSLSTPGTWNVTVAVDSAAMGYALGGKETTVVTVTNGEVTANDIFVTYNGKAQDEFSLTYTGENYLSGVAVKVVVGDKTLVEGTDYEVSYKNGKGEEVTEFTDADEYTVTVTSDTWTMPTDDSGNVCDFIVTAVPVDALSVADEVTVDGQTGVAYTGSDITPAFEYASVGADGKPVLDKNGDPVMADLPASAYKVTKIMLGGKEVKAINAVGTYTLTIADADTDDNYNVTATSATVTVIDAKVFQDVPADAWYAQVVDQAAKNGYMGGYAGTKLFGPNDKITRAQVACVLFNMAGGDYDTGNDNSDSSNYGYVSFDDVKPGAYYAKAVAWAKDAGVVNGFAGTNNFGPDQVVTREQFACMLWNYAKAMLSPTVKDVDVAAALASKPDGAKVSGWAREGVAWAVQNKVMGNGGVIDPLATVTRAETAAMAVNFQPEFIKAAVTGITATAPTGGNLTAGSTWDPRVAVTAKNGASTAFMARSSDEAVATVAADGEITAVAAGTATITYTTVGSTVNGAKLSTSIVVTVA